jgi:hypothetical protein
MSIRRLALLFVSAIALASCKVITEEMPAVPEVGGVLGTPAPGATATPKKTGEPTAEPTAKPKTPTPEPTNPPTGGGGDDGGGDGRDIPDNDKPVAKLGIVVFYISCPEGVVPGSKYATHGRRDCNVRLDCTAKDADGKPTRAKGTPVWTYGGDAGMRYKDNPRDNPYTPQVYGGGIPGVFTAYATVDGVTSNVVTYAFD